MKVCTSIHARTMTRSISTLLVLTLLVTGCTAVSPGGQTASPETVTIGAIYPLTGSLTTTGQGIKNAVELAVDIVNNEYDLNLPLAQTAGLPNLGGAKLEVVFADHAAKPEQGAAEARRLIEQDRVVALLGCYNSSVTASASQVAEESSIPFLNPESTSPTLTQRGFTWFFRTTADDAIFARNFFDFLRDLSQKRGEPVDRLAIVYENSLWGTGVSQLENQYAEEYGFTVVADVPYKSDATSVDQEVNRLLEANPSVIMQASYEPDAILFMQTYKAMGMRPEAILAMDAGFVSARFVDTLGADADYVLSREVWALDIGEQRPLIRQVNDLYRQRYGSDMNGNSARAFTGLLVLADAINRAGSTQPEAIRQALRATDIPAEQLIVPWDGVKFDPETGQNTLARGIIVQLQGGVYHTVWPWDLASAELVWPMPD